MSNKQVVLEVIAQVLADRGARVPTLEDDLPLRGGGLELDSYDMAVIVAELDARLGRDPFARGVPSFTSVGQFAALYEETT